MICMKGKTFRLDPVVAEDFEKFCDEHLLVERRVVEALLAHLMQQDAVERERILKSRWPANAPVGRVGGKRVGGIAAKKRGGTKT